MTPIIVDVKIIVGKFEVCFDDLLEIFDGGLLLCLNGRDKERKE